MPYDLNERDSRVFILQPEIAPVVADVIIMAGAAANRQMLDVALVADMTLGHEPKLSGDVGIRVASRSADMNTQIFNLSVGHESGVVACSLTMLGSGGNIDDALVKSVRKRRGEPGLRLRTEAVRSQRSSHPESEVLDEENIGGPDVIRSLLEPVIINAPARPPSNTVPELAMPAISDKIVAVSEDNLAAQVPGVLSAVSGAMAANKVQRTWMNLGLRLHVDTAGRLYRAGDDEQKVAVHYGSNETDDEVEFELSWLAASGIALVACRVDAVSNRAEWVQHRFGQRGNELWKYSVDGIMGVPQDDKLSDEPARDADFASLANIATTHITKAEYRNSWPV